MIRSIEVIPESIQLLKMDDEVYFSEQYRDYISNSKLGLVNPEEDGSIEKYKEGFKGGYNASFELGSAIHAIVLQPELFYISTFRKPGGKIGIFVEEVNKLRQKGYSIQEAITEGSIKADYYSGKLVGGRLKTAIKSGIGYYYYLNNDAQIEMTYNSPKTPIYLSESTYKNYEKCIQQIYKNSDIGNTLKPDTLFTGSESYNEYAILCEAKVTIGEESIILKIKGKLDNFIIDHINNTIILNDLKTTSKPCSFFMGNKVKFIEDDKTVWKWINGSFQKYFYARQMSMYTWLLQCAIRKEFGLEYKSKVNMVVVETLPNFESKVFPVTNKDIKKGLDEMKNLLICVAEWKIQKLIE